MQVNKQIDNNSKIKHHILNKPCGLILRSITIKARTLFEK